MNLAAFIQENLHLTTAKLVVKTPLGEDILLITVDEDSNLQFEGELHLCQLLEPEFGHKIIAHLERGHLSGMDVFPNGRGFAHWHIRLYGETN